MTVTTELGEVLRDADGVRLQFVRTYDAPIADVWSAITDPERMQRWVGTWTGDSTTGRVMFAMTAEGDVPAESVEIVKCEPPRLLHVIAGSPDGPWPLTFELSEDAGVTTLRFVHTMAEPYDASGIGPGWHYYLDRLDAALANREVPNDFDPYLSALSSRYPIPA